jgi:hypothetical protein
MINPGGFIKLRDPEIFSCEIETKPTEVTTCKAVQDVARILITSASLHDSSSYSSEFNLGNLNLMLTDLVPSYSSFLLSTLKKMLEQNDKSSFISLNRKLLPHRENIKSLKPFDPVTPSQEIYSCLKLNESRIFLTSEGDCSTNVNEQTQYNISLTGNNISKPILNFKKKKRKENEILVSNEIFSLARNYESNSTSDIRPQGKISNTEGETRLKSSAKSLKRKIEDSLKSSTHSWEA